MTIEQAIAIIHQEYLCVDRDCNIEKNCGKCDLAMPSKEPILEAYNMAIKALSSSENPNKWMAADVLNHWIGEEVLDKIRAEIDEQYDRVHPYNISCAEGLEMALDIIDKYRVSPTGAEGSEE